MRCASRRAFRVSVRTWLDSLVCVIVSMFVVNTRAAACLNAREHACVCVCVRVDVRVCVCVVRACSVYLYIGV